MFIKISTYSGNCSDLTRQRKCLTSVVCYWHLRNRAIYILNRGFVINSSRIFWALRFFLQEPRNDDQILVINSLLSLFISIKLLPFRALHAEIAFDVFVRLQMSNVGIAPN